MWFYCLKTSRNYRNLYLPNRCDQLDAALNEASARIKTLENKNSMLEKQVVSMCSW